jgi:hypothetical protein
MKMVRLLGIVLALCVPMVLVAAGSASAAEGDVITGTVTDEGGQPLAGIEVCAYRPPISPSDLYPTCVLTDAAGEYSVPGEAGYRVYFYDFSNQPPGYAPQMFPGGGFQGSLTPEEVENGVDAVMQVGAELHGTVLATGGAPIQGVEVCSRRGPCTFTDASGAYVIRGLGEAAVQVRFETGGDVNYIGRVLETEPLVLGEASELNASLQPGVRISGVVTSALTGRPIQESEADGIEPVRVCVNYYPRPAVEPKCAFLAPDGSYSIPGLFPNAELSVQFGGDYYPAESIHPGFDGWISQYWQCAPKLEEATPLTGAPGASIEGIDAELLPGGDGEKAPCLPHSDEPTPPTSGSGSQSPATNPPPATTAPVGKPKPVRKCRKGFRKVAKGGHARCVKIHKKKARHRKARHHRHGRHHFKASRHVRTSHR